ncbi:OLC1v1008576C1 [Oldenlandia corymbosa var. corymbosa]|uniref:OLC1v1008576C1 n=1 Tax=Oldenlandia corymbosa var. corymbosa TaxID=529605 RepID=A0AAV1DM31_OLDCO|nr:OLC1v1008576C1 [Oldenlandia corymbosa var. corymbosa]
MADIGAGTSGGRTVEENEDREEDEDGGGVETSDDGYVPSDEDSDDDTDFDSSSSVPYIFDDINGWDKTLEEEDSDGIKMWDSNAMTVDLDVHFTNKLEAQAAVGEWNLRHGRTFRVNTSSKGTWYVECETCGPKYPKERLHDYDCLWKAQVSLQKATDTWKMVVWSDSHNCLGTNKRNESRNVTSSMITRLVAQNVRKHPDFTVAQIQIEVFKRFGVGCRRGSQGVDGRPVTGHHTTPEEICSEYSWDTGWSHEKKVQGITRFNLAAYRDQLAVLAESDFRIPGDGLLLTRDEITSLLKRKPFGRSDRSWTQQLGIYLQVWNDRHNRLVGTDDEYVGEPIADSEHLLWYHQVTVKYVTDPTDSESTRGFHGATETLRLMATLMEDVHSLSIIGQRTFDKDSFGYDRLGKIVQVAERALSVNATNVVRHNLEKQDEVYDILSQELGLVDPTQQYPPPKPPRHSRRSQRRRGRQETITPTQPHQSSQHQQSHIPFTQFSSHQSPHQSPHHSLQHSSHHSPHHSLHSSVSPTQQVFYRPIMSPQHQQSHFAFTQFSSHQPSQPQFGDSFIDLYGFQQSSLDGQSLHYTSNFLSSMFEGVAGQHQADDPAGGECESQGEDEDEDADQQDQFEGQGYQRHEEQGPSQNLETPPLVLSKGQRVRKEPDRLTYSHFRAKKSKKK